MRATQILQNYLDNMSDIVLRGDIDGYLRGVDLPFQLVTTDSTFFISSHEEMKKGFDSFRAMLLSQQVTAYIRLVSTASLLDDRIISGHYTTHVISGGNRVMAPFPSQMVLRLGLDDHWRCASVTNGAKNARWPIDRLVVDPPYTDDPVSTQ